MHRISRMPPRAATYSLGFPKLSQNSLANADSWFWLAFASVIFFIVTIGCRALYARRGEQHTQFLALRAITITVSASSRNSISCSLRIGAKLYVSRERGVMNAMLAVVTATALIGGGAMAVRSAR